MEYKSLIEKIKDRHFWIDLKEDYKISDQVYFCELSIIFKIAWTDYECKEYIIREAEKIGHKDFCVTPLILFNVINKDMPIKARKNIRIDFIDHMIKKH